MKYRLLAIFLSCFLSTALAAETYGPILKQDTLWGIASRVRTTHAVNVQQVMLALKNKNPQAFTSSNINALKQGAYLTIPSLPEIQRLSRVEAIRVTRKQNMAWNTRGAASNTASIANITHSNRQIAQIQSVNQRLREQVSLLNQQLNLARAESRHLASKLKNVQTLKADPATPSISIEVARKVQKLTAEVKELQAAIEEKDNYISNLRNTLKSASETIKRQQNDNQRIFAELKARQAMPQDVNTPDNTTTPAQSAAPVLQLSAVNEETATTTPSRVTEDSETNAPNPAMGNVPSVSNVMQPANDVKVNQALPLSNSLSQRADTAATQAVGQTQDNGFLQTLGIPAPSNISLVIALLVALFIGALLWFKGKKYRQDKAYLPEPEKDKYIDRKG